MKMIATALWIGKCLVNILISMADGLTFIADQLQSMLNRIENSSPDPSHQINDADIGPDQPAPNQPAIDVRDQTPTLAVGSFYAFYFWEFLPSSLNDLTCWKNDHNSISQIAKSTNVKVNGHFKERRNLKREEFLRFLKKISSSRRETSVDYLFFYLLSHGDENANIYTHDGSLVLITDIIGYFQDDNCERFRAKPKIFVFQCCRGNKVQPSHSRADLVGPRLNYTIECTQRLTSETVRIRHSMGNNMFLAFAATPDHVALCNEEGSFFTKHLREVILCNGKTENLNMLMTRVNKRMSVQPRIPQMSFFVSRLTGEFKFNVPLLSEDSDMPDLNAEGEAETDPSINPDIPSIPEPPIALDNPLTVTTDENEITFF